MADPPPFRDGDDPTGADADRESPPSTPRWVRVFGIIAVVIVLLVLIGLLLGGGRHGPGRHTSLGDVHDATSGSRVTAQDVPRP